MSGKTAAWILLGTFGAALLGNAARIRQLASKLGDDWNMLHPEFQARALAVLDAANTAFAKDGLRVGIYDGYRDVSDQLREIQEGDSFLSHPLNGYHPWGLAADFVFIDRAGRWTWLPDPADPSNTGYIDPRWYELGAIIEAAGLEWGGRWDQFDGPHAQLDIARPSELRREWDDNPLAFIQAQPQGVFA